MRPPQRTATEALPGTGRCSSAASASSTMRYVVVAAVAGILAAAMPARRAARLPILGTLAHE
jgi:ABC-type lipoprotein release transport system permease subunit